MSQFEFTINGTTLQLTADDVVKLEAAMLDATKSSTGKAFRQGSTNIYARLLSEQGSSAQRFNKTSPADYVETDC